MENSVEALLPMKSNKTDDFIPKADNLYVPFGFFNNLLNIIQRGVFYPVYITGLSGNGKTKMVEQVCAQANREMIRVNITKETDEFDLIGAYELIDGNTVWRDGPVLIALKRGAVLLLDEVDLGTERLLCLQPILEGVGYFNKKRAEFISPAKGFTVIATANTKGRGSIDGKFIGTNTLNEAFLERFAITVEQDYPNEKTEQQILKQLFLSLDTTPEMKTDEFAMYLCKWAEIIRKSYKDDACDEVITTRRLCHIVKAYSIFQNRKTAIELCLNRFDAEAKTAFFDLYSKIDKDYDKKLSNAEELVKKRKEAQAKAGAAAKTNFNSIPNPVPTANVGPQFVNTSSQSTFTMNIFGDARNVSNVMSRYKVPVNVTRDKSTGDAYVTVSGVTVRVPAGDIINSKIDLLDEVVSKILTKET